VPDFIRARREYLDVLRQFVVGIGEDKNLHFLRWIGRPAGRCQVRPPCRLIIIEGLTARSTNCVGGDSS
jgi:hypothetical protein